MGEWTWMKGTNSVDQPAVPGTMGTFASANTPPNLYEPCEWTDLNGNFWLFGGEDYNGNQYCDLWEFKPSTNQWAWIKGPGTINQNGVYGTQGVPSLTNNPGCRGYGIPTWVDTAGYLWLYGGNGNGVSAYGILGDLWKYNISTNEWTWIGGPNTVNDTGSYGTILVPSATNKPPAKQETNAAWTDNHNCLWLFGGKSPIGDLSDVWKYNISANQWTWMKGPKIGDQPAVYGTKGTPDTGNTPSGRWIHSKWKDDNGNFWIFGGQDNAVHTFGDLWRFNPTTNVWTWMSGTSTPNDTTTIGTPCIPAVNNKPGNRMENRSCWTRCGNFMMFGGANPSHFLNDLWNYNVATNEWTLINGSVITNNHGSYGTVMVSSATNLPPSRMGSVAWSDNSGNLWMFGGEGFNFVQYNDMWRFVPDT